MRGTPVWVVRTGLAKPIVWAVEKLVVGMVVLILTP